MCGSYADMHAGRVSEALLDFSGGVHMHFDLKSAPADLWRMMYHASQAHALMGCETRGVSSNYMLGQWVISFVGLCGISKNIMSILTKIFKYY